MARILNKLTATKIAKLAKRGRYGDGGGLWFNVGPSLGKSWVFRWTPRGGQPREMGLGPFPAVPLASVRALAAQCREHAAAGRDPREERDRDIGKTFGEVANLYLDAMDSRWTNEKTRWQWKDTLQVRCSRIHKRPIAEITTADILSILKPIWAETPETASRIRMRMENVIDYGKAQGWRQGDNPGRWRGHLENILPRPQKLVQRHHAAMPYQELPVFMDRLAELKALAARALELLILTASRTSEILKAEWTEFDLEAGIWVIPAERMKAKRDHRIPLTEEALSILWPLSEACVSDFVFPGQKPGKPLSAMSMEMLLRRMKVENATVHGFRSTFRDWCGDETNFPREVAEAALAHKVGNDIEQAYRRSDALEKRRRLMEAWSKYCTASSTDNLVHLNA